MLTPEDINPSLKSLGGTVKRWIGKDALALTLFDGNSNDEDALVGVLVISGDVEDLEGKTVNFTYGINGTETVSTILVRDTDGGDWAAQYGWGGKVTYYARLELPGQHIRGILTAEILP